MGDSAAPLALGGTNPALAGGGSVGEPGSTGSLAAAIHRLLRGRYRWALLLAAVGGAVGGYFGWKSQVPMYRSEGLVYIEASMPSPLDPAGQEVLPMINAFVALQVRLLESSTNLAMATDTWQRTGRGASPSAVAAFTAHRRVIFEPGNLHLVIEFIDEDPGVALAGVESLIEAYGKLSEVENANDQRLTYMTAQVDSLSSQLKECADEILKRSAAFGSIDGLESRIASNERRILNAEEDLSKVQALMRDLAVAAAPSGAPRALTPEEIALESGSMADAIYGLQVAEARQKALAQKFGDQNDELIAVRADIEVRKQWIAQLQGAWNQRLVQAYRQSPNTSESGAAAVETLKKRLTEAESRLADLREQNQELLKAQYEIGRKRNEREQLAEQLERMKLAKAQLSAQLVGKGRIRIASTGTKANFPFKDRRFSMAGAGGLLCAAAGVFVVLLFGLRDRRLRDTGDLRMSLSTLRLLGLMPSLSTDFGDPEQAEHAAHCVHQIRTQLQIVHARDGGSCLAVTGATVGSGKTTLSLAIGLSFAKSGTRTLLVDADLTGRGLTARIGQMLLSHAVGLMRKAEVSRTLAGGGSEESVPSPQLLASLVPGRSPDPALSPSTLVEILRTAAATGGLEFVRKSGLLGDLYALSDLRLRGDGRAELTAELSALLAGQPEWAPAGTAEWVVPAYAEVDPGHPELDRLPLDRYLFTTAAAGLRFLPLRGLDTGGNVSASTVARVLRRLRGEFDMIIVDTGPVLGAVETSMFAAHADGVVFVVAPGDERPDAEFAVARLLQVGAHVDGIVFNRAVAKDVIRSSRSRSVSTESSD